MAREKTWMTKGKAVKLLDPIHNTIKRHLETGEAIDGIEFTMDAETATAFIWAFQALVHWNKEEADGEIRNQRLDYTESKRYHPDISE